MAFAGTTHALRLDWSTDGTFLVSAHAMNNGAPTAQLVLHSRFIERLPSIYTKALRASHSNGTVVNGGANGSKQTPQRSRQAMKRKRSAQRGAGPAIEQENERWLRAVDFAGHRKAIAVVRFLPTLLKSAHSECAASFDAQYRAVC